ncbi:hypothetical protein F0562_032427 [Nyssa sinensis]|uniref:Uncharacterized protein n=1 Tax=Nyssa sinensis TaxID=561372 RepID=A0A5J5AQ14_9ASTE|nr:hypothetical protein F0562_032427 [Nyssa sinensis]
MIVELALESGGDLEIETCAKDSCASPHMIPFVGFSPIEAPATRTRISLGLASQKFPAPPSDDNMYWYDFPMCKYDVSILDSIIRREFHDFSNTGIDISWFERHFDACVVKQSSTAFFNRM